MGCICWDGWGWQRPFLPSFPKEPHVDSQHGKRPWLGLVIAPFLGTALLALLNLVTPVSELGGMLIGGALALWFLLTGLAWLFIGFRIRRPTRRSLLLGAVAFCFTLGRFWRVRAFRLAALAAHPSTASAVAGVGAGLPALAFGGRLCPRRPKWTAAGFVVAGAQHHAGLGFVAGRFI